MPIGPESFDDLLDASGQIVDWGKGMGRKLGKGATRVWWPEDPEFVLEKSSFFGRWPVEEVEPDYLSVLWRAEALMALSALGVGFLEDEIIGFTREVFHDRPGHRGLSERLFGTDWNEIHRWMDTVPGASVPGGGIMHRLQHGHDLQGLQEVWDRHGLAGGLVWVQHNSQDLFTPTGIPLPLGSGRMAEWIVDQGYMTPGKAALLVSFNAVELSAVFLTGAFALRMISAMAEGYRQLKVRRRCNRAGKAYVQGDLEGAIELYKEAYALSDRSPFISLALGWCYASKKSPAAESFLYFREAARGLATENSMVEIDGLQVSLRGISYLLALTEATRVLDQEHVRTHWRDEMETMWRSAMVSFEQAALRQDEPPGVVVRGVEVEWRPRPMSASVNYYLAARACSLMPFLPQAETKRLARKSEGTLGKAIQMYPDSRDQLRAVRVRWSHELRPRAEPLIEASST